MKTLFSMGFQPYDPFTLRHPALGQLSDLMPQIFQEGQTAQGAYNAQAEAARNKIKAQLVDGNLKLASVKAWIASKIDQDPMLRNTLTKGDPERGYVVDNFWGYVDLANKDQYYADLAQSDLGSGGTPSDDTLRRVDEWNQVIDILNSVMLEYRGGPAPAAVKAGPTISPTTGQPVRGGVAPGATINTPPPASGIPTGTLLVGGAAVLAAIGLAALLRG